MTSSERARIEEIKKEYYKDKKESRVNDAVDKSSGF